MRDGEPDTTGLKLPLIRQFVHLFRQLSVAVEAVIKPYKSVYISIYGHANRSAAFCFGFKRDGKINFHDPPATTTAITTTTTTTNFFVLHRGSRETAKSTDKSSPPRQC